MLDDLFKNNPSTPAPEVKELTPKELSADIKPQVEEAKTVAKTHHEQHLELVAEMNKVLAGRLESELGLDDPYWKARNKMLLHRNQ